MYNDRDGDLVQFFEILRDRCEELVEWLDRTPYSREIYDEWAVLLPSVRAVGRDVRLAIRVRDLEGPKSGPVVHEESRPPPSVRYNADCITDVTHPLPAGTDLSGGHSSVAA